MIYYGVAILVVICMTLNFASTQSKVVGLALIVPGGGLQGNGSLPRHTKVRLDKAIELFSVYKSSNPVIVALSAGTTHKPNPVDNNNFPIYESSAAIKYLLSHGISPNLLLEEKLSLDTIGNVMYICQIDRYPYFFVQAYFLRTLHTEPSDIRNLIVITNDWHVDRVQAIFDTVFGLPLTDGYYTKPSSSGTKYSVEYVAVDSCLPPEVHTNRMIREKNSLQTFLSRVKPTLKSLKDLHRMVFVEHAAYSAVRLTNHFAPEKVDATTRESY